MLKGIVAFRKTICATFEAYWNAYWIAARNQFVRGNLYAALVNYLHLISSAEGRRDLPDYLPSLKRSLSLATSMSREDLDIWRSLSWYYSNTPDLYVFNIRNSNHYERRDRETCRCYCSGCHRRDGSMEKPLHFMSLDSLVTSLSEENTITRLICTYSTWSSVQFCARSEESELKTSRRFESLTQWVVQLLY